jgi:hypothetical protein
MVHIWDHSKPIERRRGVLARHFALDDKKWLESGSVEETLDYLDIWKAHSSDILELAEQVHPSESKISQTLFGFAPTAPKSTIQNPMFQVLRDSFLNSGDGSNNALELSGSTIDSLLKSQLPDQLRKRIYNFHASLLESTWTQPPGVQHSFRLRSDGTLPPIATTDNGINSRLRVMSRSLPILGVLTGGDRSMVSQVWLRRLFDILRPMSGELYDLSMTQVFSDNSDSTPILLTWLQDNSSRLWSTPAIDLAWSDALATLALSSALSRTALNTVADTMLSDWHNTERTKDRRVLKDLILLFHGTGVDRLTGATLAVR